MTKTYNLTISKFYDKTIQAPVLEIGCTDQVIELLANFTIKTETKNSSFMKRPLEENDDRRSSAEYIKRYLIKSVLVNSINDDCGWDNIFDLLFTPEICNDKKIKIALMSDSAFHNIEYKIKNLKNLISKAEELLTSKTIKVEFTLTEAKQ